MNKKICEVGKPRYCVFYVSSSFTMLVTILPNWEEVESYLRGVDGGEDLSIVDTYKKYERKNAIL